MARLAVQESRAGAVSDRTDCPKKLNPLDGAIFLRAPLFRKNRDPELRAPHFCSFQTPLFLGPSLIEEDGTVVLYHDDAF